MPEIRQRWKDYTGTCEPGFNSTFFHPAEVYAQAYTPKSDGRRLLAAGTSELGSQTVIKIWRSEQDHRSTGLQVSNVLLTETYTSQTIGYCSFLMDLIGWDFRACFGVLQVHFSPTPFHKTPLTSNQFQHCFFTLGDYRVLGVRWEGSIFVLYFVAGSVWIGSGWR